MVYITRDDILPTPSFLSIRQETLKDILRLKKDRRLHVGPYMTLHFENYTTLWWQIQEMLRVEEGGVEQIQDELNAYNPLVPQGQELVATMMIEVEDAQLRRQMLGLLSHIDQHLHLEFAGHCLSAQAEQDVDRTREDGKTSAVHFVRWVFTPGQIQDFIANAEVRFNVNHPHYSYQVILPENIRQSLIQDFVIAETP